MPSSDRSTTGHVVNLPESDRLRAELATLAGAARGDLVARIKEIRQRERDATASQVAEHLGEITGVDISLQLTAVTDEIVRFLARQAFTKAGASPSAYDQGLGLFATGGYGRGELNPGSDLDLLVLIGENRLPGWAQAGNQELQTLLWDVGFQVGASMRSLAELERIMREDFVTATSVIEGRRFDGSPLHQETLSRMLDTWRRKRAKEFLRYKLEELEQRRERTGESLFLMEPNLKSNPGCLRDVQLLRNIGFVLSGSRNIMALEELDVITQEDLDEVVAANDHLLLLRSLNHFHHGRKHDVFQLPDQLRVAKQLGYQDVSRLRDVEHLMHRHYELVLRVHQTVDLALSRLKALGHLGRRPILILSRRVLDKDFTSVDGKVYLSDKAGFWNHPDAGARLLHMCRLAQGRDLRIALELQRDIREHLSVVTDEVRHDPTLGRVFLEILAEVGRVRPILADMHACGLLGAYLPEFGNLTCHMQFDSYHQYTVDEHTLIAVGNLDLFARGQMDGLPDMRRAWDGVRRRDLLNLGLLLHDVGKYMGRGHVARGAMMVAPVARRLGLREEEEELVYFLVERHVSLSDASRMRDFHEPAFLAGFTERIGDESRLDHLYCLTWADAKAVGAGVLTGWQEALLGELRQAVLGDLQRRQGQAPTGHHDRLRTSLVAAGQSQEEAEAWLAQLPLGYLYQVHPDEVRRHLEVLQEAQAGRVGMRQEVRGDSIFLTAAFVDRHALFADVTGTLTGHSLDIIDSRIWVTTGGMVLYTFRLRSPMPGRGSDASFWNRLRKDLAAVHEGTLSAEAILARRRSGYGAVKPPDSQFDDPAVKVDGRTSDHHTIIDIHAKDETGLLSRLCRAISDFGCEITYASINTMGDVAVDVFYVDRNGKKLADQDAENLRGHLIEALRLV